MGITITCPECGTIFDVDRYYEKMKQDFIIELDKIVEELKGRGNDKP